MDKRGILCVLLLIVLVSGFVIAAEADLPAGTADVEDENAFIDDAYNCLEQLVPANKTALSFEEAVFSILALGGQKNLINKTEEFKSAAESCWPKKKCTLKDTAMVALAYERIGKDNKEILKWIMSKNATTRDLTWYLQIDISDQKSASCSVKTGTTEYKLNVKEDMALEGTQIGGCLEIVNNYWLKIADNCLEKGYDVSCNQPFVTSLLYQKKGGSGTVYVTSTTQSGSTDGHTIQNINAKCFMSGGSCDYEGNLWAVLALNKAGEDTEFYVPYLISLAEDNKKYFSSAFIYAISSPDEQYNDIIQSQNAEGYWEMPLSPYKKFYDTALGVFALQDEGGANLESAKNYLKNTQTRDGCWDNNNIKNTAFLLYALDPRNVGAVADPAGGSSAESRDCELSGFYCGLSSDCTTANGILKSEKSCTSLTEICCSVNIERQSCTQVGGTICSYGEACDDTIVQASEGPCCLGECEVQEVQEENLCEDAGGSCRADCFSDEEEADEICPSSIDVCCGEKAPSSGGWIWVMIILILVVLVVLGIWKRDKLKVWIYKIKEKFKKKPETPQQRGPPQLGGRVFPTRPQAVFPGTGRILPSARPAGRQMSGKDREMEETLRRLKEIGK